MKMRWTIITSLTVALMMATMVACGGGGGGDSVSYTGETMAAVIDTTDSVDFARDALFGAMEGDLSIDPDELFPLAVAGSDTLKGLLDPDVVAGIMINALTGEPASSPLAVKTDPLAYQCFNESGSGTYGGTASGRICGDYDGETFTSIDYIRATFHDYSEDGVTFLDGTMELDVRVEGRMALFFNHMSLDDDVDELYLDGRVVFTETPTSASIDFNIFILINGEGIWYNNLVLVEEDFFTYITDSIDGRVYDILKGYIDLETIEDLVIQDGDIYPSEGIVKLTGADGASIRLEVVDNTGFMIYVDVDGDGIDDWKTATPQPWEVG